MLRFTRFNVKPNSFESKMEYTNDNGEIWKLGNHQDLFGLNEVAKERHAVV